MCDPIRLVLNCHSGCCVNAQGGRTGAGEDRKGPVRRLSR